MQQILIGNPLQLTPLGYRRLYGKKPLTTLYLFVGMNNRTDSRLIELFNSDAKREFFNYDCRPRLIIIPKEIKWSVRQSSLGNEYVQEKARSWS